MAIFGFIVFLLITLAVSVLGLAVWTWPNNKRFSGERLFMAAIMCITWGVVIINNPFSITVM